MSVYIQGFPACCGACIVTGMDRPGQLKEAMARALKTNYKLMFGVIANWQEHRNRACKKFIADLKKQGANITPYFDNHFGTAIMGFIVHLKPEKKTKISDSPYSLAKEDHSTPMEGPVMKKKDTKKKKVAKKKSKE